MTFMLASEGSSDAELLHRIASGDPGSAARLWTRHWPVALEAARGLVDPVEVPGLAAEALIGTLAAVALGSGPAEDVQAFVVAAVHELGEDEDGAPSGTAATTAAYPDVFTSTTLVQAFDALTPEDQDVLRSGAPDVASSEPLRRLQDGYLRLHARAGATSDCVDLHSYLGAAIEDADPAIPARSWLHLSECVVCTEAFHELAHTGVALGALLGVAPAPVAQPVAQPEDQPEDQPVAQPDPAAAAAAALLTALAADEHFDATVALAADPEEQVVVEAFAGPAETAAETSPEPVAQPVAQPEAQPVDGAGAERRRRRPLLILAAAAVLVSILGVSVAVSRDDDPAQEPVAATPIPDSGPVLESAPPAVTDPTTAVQAADSDVPNTEPEPAVADAPASTAASKPRSSTSARPSSKATPRPASSSTQPSPSSSGTSAAPPSSPTPTKSPTGTPSKSPSTSPTPSPTPTKTCSPLEVLLGCRPN